MTTVELLNNFGKGNTQFIKLSEKQMNWLISTANREGILEGTGNRQLILLPDLRIYEVKQGSYMTSGVGGLIGKRPSGRYSASLHYHVRFKSTGLTTMYRIDFLESQSKICGKANHIDGHEYEIIPYKS